jgi:DNA-binding SARP family transcriptional activator
MQPRQHLVALLWPESNPERSYANFRNILGHLLKGLQQIEEQTDSVYLSITHQALGLNLDANIDFDLRTVESAYRMAHADRSNRTLPDGSSSQPLLQLAAANYRGDFLAGFSLGDAPGFDDWAAIQQDGKPKRTEPGRITAIVELLVWSDQL